MPTNSRSRAKKPSPPPRTRLGKDERARQLLEVGLRVFSERPYDELSIDELAAHAKISKGLLYHYFPTKRDYYVATVREAARRLAEETRTPEGLAPVERLDRGLRAYLAFAERHRIAYLALMRGGVGADAEVAAVVEETREALLLRVMSEASLSGSEVRLALRGWIGFVEATMGEWLVSRAVDREGLLALWVRALFAIAGLPR